MQNKTLAISQGDDFRVMNFIKILSLITVIDIMCIKKCNSKHCQSIRYYRNSRRIVHNKTPAKRLRVDSLKHLRWDCT